MTDEQVLASRDDLEMMRRPHLWPAGNYLLPLKHRSELQSNGLRRTAILFHFGNDFGLLEDGNILLLSPADVERINWADEHILPEINQDWMVD